MQSVDVAIVGGGMVGLAVACGLQGSGLRVAVLEKASGLTLSSGEIELPAAEDMLPLACYLLAAGKTVAVEKAEPVYLRNEVAWKKLPGRE